MACLKGHYSLFKGKVLSFSICKMTILIMLGKCVLNFKFSTILVCFNVDFVCIMQQPLRVMYWNVGMLWYTYSIRMCTALRDTDWPNPCLICHSNCVRSDTSAKFAPNQPCGFQLWVKIGYGNKSTFKLGSELFATFADLSIIGNAWEALLFWWLQVGIAILRSISVACRVFCFSVALADIKMASGQTHEQPHQDKITRHHYVSSKWHTMVYLYIGNIVLNEKSPVSPLGSNSRLFIMR